MHDDDDIEDDNTEHEVDSILPKDIFNTIVNDAAVHGAATDEFVKSFSFYGKSLKEHSEDLYIQIPDNPTPIDIRNSFFKLIKNIQITTHYLSIASSISNAISNGGQIKKSDLVAVIVRGYESRNARRPSGAVLERIAESYMSETVNVRIAAKIVRDFWSNMLESLIEVRKCLEQVSISMHVEMKHMES
jgi:hypothetical protein